MPRSSCDFCCRPVQLALTTDSYRGAVLQALCKLIELDGTELASQLKVSSVTPTIDTAIYAAGDLIGGKLVFTDVIPNGIITSVNIIDRDNEAADLEINFFTVDPTNTTFTDNAPFDPDLLDIINMLPPALVNTHSAFANNGLSYATNLNIPYKVAGTTLWGAIKSIGTPTYTNDDDLTVIITTTLL